MVGATEKGASQVAQKVKNLPAMQETRFNPWAREDLLEKGMATHFSTLAWRIPVDRRAWRLQFIELQSQSNYHTYNGRGDGPLYICEALLQKPGGKVLFPSKKKKKVIGS